MESCCDLLGHMRCLYGFESEDEGTIKICRLARVCQQLLIILEEEEDELTTFPELHKQILKYLLQMCPILHAEQNQKRKKIGCDILSELTDRLT